MPAIIILGAIVVFVVCVAFLKTSEAKDKEKVNPKAELQSLRQEYRLSQRVPCSKEDNKKYAQMVKDGQPLPSGVYDYKYENTESEYYTIYTPDISADELAELLTYKKLGYLRTIKNCVVYFVVLSVIALCAYLIILVQMA